MEWWQQLLDTALLGTDKRQLDTSIFPEALEKAIASTSLTDKEEQFLQAASLAFNYRQCGVQPFRKEGVSITPAEEEVKAYGTPAQLQTLRDILEEENLPLLTLWLELCADKELLVQPDLLPEILSAGAQHKKLQYLVAACAGKRGEWLSRFNPQWHFSSTATEEELWQTGSPEQRKTVLKQLRQQDPARAREWLQATWAQEDANTRADLLTILATNIGKDDLVFLESLSTDKSKKVKDLALRLLKLIPSSSIIQQYENVLSASIKWKKEKSMLGLLSKETLTISLPENIDENIYKTGIERLSNVKGMADELFVLYQLAQIVPPSWWQQELNVEPAYILSLLEKDKVASRLLPALAEATQNHRDVHWAQALAGIKGQFFPGIIPLLSIREQETYSLQQFNAHADEIISYAVDREDEWSTELTRTIFKHTAKNFYQYSRHFYQQHILRIPASIEQELASLAPQEPYQQSAWSNTSAVIIKLLHLKTQTRTSFKALK